MTKYLETVVPGEVTSWRRASEIRLINSEPPESKTIEVERTVYPDGFTRDVVTAQFDFTLTPANSVVEIPIVDPETYEPTEQTFTTGQFALMATSFYFWQARNRDGTP